MCGPVPAAPLRPIRSVSVLMPTWQGMEFLGRSLAALARQELDLTWDFLAVDSGSTDGTWELLEERADGFPVPLRRERIHQVEFDHGDTRNLLAARTAGDLCVFLTQDAIPVGGDWLARLVANFEDPLVAAAYCRNLPRPDADLLTKVFSELDSGYVPGRRETRLPDAATYAARREDESRRGLAEIGVGDAVYWRLPDNCVLSDSDYELGFELATAAIREYRPDVVYLPWEAEGHPDHHALHRIVIEALRRSTFVGLAFGYEVWNAMVPDVVVDITAVAEQKRRGIRAHATQTAYVDFEHTILGLNAYRSMVHARGRGYCEGLRRIAPIAAPPGDAT